MANKILTKLLSKLYYYMISDKISENLYRIANKSLGGGVQEESFEKVLY